MKHEEKEIKSLIDYTQLNIEKDDIYNNWKYSQNIESEDFETVTYLLKLINYIKEGEK